jgi:hypothetical protein
MLAVAAPGWAQAPVYAPQFTLDVGQPGANSPYPHAVAIDSKGRVIVANPGQNTVEVRQCDAAHHDCVLVASYGTVGDPIWMYNYVPPAGVALAYGIIPTTIDSTLGCELAPGAPVRGRPCLAAPQGVAVDATDRIYLADTANYRVLVFNSADNVNADGTLQLVYAFGTFAGTVVEIEPADADGNPILDALGNPIDVLFEQPSLPQPDHFALPWDIVVNKKTGEVFVLDQWNNQIKGFRFDPTVSNFKQFVAFGHRGDTAADPEGLVFPSGLGIDQTTGDLAVADSGKHRVVVYTYPFTNNTLAPFTAGTRASAVITTAGPGGPDVFGRNTGYAQQGDVAFDRAHRVFILDSVSSSVHVFAKSGAAYAFQFTIKKAVGAGTGELADSIGFAIDQPDDPLNALDLEHDPAGQMAFADSYAGRVQVFQHASLSAVVTSISATAALGDPLPITARITVTNNGFLPLTGVVPTLDGYEGLISSYTLTPPLDATLAAGGQREFMASLTPQSTGSLNLRVGATGNTHYADRSGEANELVVAPVVIAPTVAIGCAPAGALVLERVTVDSSLVQSGKDVTLHVRLRNCSATPLQASPIVTLLPPSVPVTVKAGPASMQLDGRGAIDAAGHPTDTRTWDVTYVAGSVTGTATFQVSAQTADGSASASTPVRVTITITSDTAPPITTATISPAPADVVKQIYKGMVTVQLSATDVGTAGIGAIHCSYVLASTLGGPHDCSPQVSGNPATFTAPQPFTLPHGEVTLVFWSEDAARPKPNAEAPHVATLVIDNTRPSVSWNVSQPPNAAGWHNRPVTASFTADDTLTSIASIAPSIALTTPTSFYLNDPDAVFDPLRLVVTDVAGNATTSDTVIRIDQLPPALIPTRTPTANANGWNNSLPVVVSWKIEDLPPAACPRGACQASGLTSVGTMTCPTGGCQPLQVPVVFPCPAGACPGAPPTTITTEGKTHVIAAACDVADNCGTVDAQVLVAPIMVDVTPPEAYNQFDPITKTNLVYARDNLSGVPSTPVMPASAPAWWTRDDDEDNDEDDRGHENWPAELRVYTITDAAFNSELLTEKVHADGHEVHVGVVSFLYTTGCPLKCNSKLGIVPSGTSKKFEWSTNKDGSLKMLDQNMTIGRGESRTHVKASYDSTKNQTTIHSDAKNPSKITLPGLVLMRLATDAGGVVIEYTNPATGTTVVFTP